MSSYGIGGTIISGNAEKQNEDNEDLLAKVEDRIPPRAAYVGRQLCDEEAQMVMLRRDPRAPGLIKNLL